MHEKLTLFLETYYRKIHFSHAPYYLLFAGWNAANTMLVIILLLTTDDYVDLGLEMYEMLIFFILVFGLFFSVEVFIYPLLSTILTLRKNEKEKK